MPSGLPAPACSQQAGAFWYLPWNMTAPQHEHLSVATPKSPDAKPLNANAPNASKE
jgi:hypothetical protein